MTAPQSPQSSVDASDAVGERDYGDSTMRDRMLHLANVIRRSARIRSIGPNSLAILGMGHFIMLTPAESEAAADAILASDWLAARDDRMRREGAAGVVEAVCALAERIKPDETVPVRHRMTVYVTYADLTAALAPFTQGGES